MHGSENLHLNGLIRYAQESFEKKDNVWSQDIMVDQYKHERKKGVTYQHEIKGTLGIDITQETATKAIKSYGMKRNIYEVMYHPMNQGAMEQDMDAFESSMDNKNHTFW